MPELLLIDLFSVGSLAAIVIIFAAAFAVLYFAFRFFKRSVKMAIRMALIAAILVIVVIGAFSLWWFGSEALSTPKTKSAPTRAK